MSYVSTVGGGATFRGFGYQGMSGTYPVRHASAEMGLVQRELQRLGYLQSGSGVYGADGKFGPRTATALRGAARYVAWSDAPYSPSNAGEMRSGDVDIPDDLIDRLRAASPNPAAPYASGDNEPASADAPVDPSPDGATATAPDVGPSTVDSGGTGWVPAAIIGGGVLAVGVTIAYSMRSKKPTRNRRRRRRTSRRRH